MKTELQQVQWKRNEAGFGQRDLQQCWNNTFYLFINQPEKKIVAVIDLLNIGIACPTIIV